MKLFASDYDGTLHLHGEVSADTLTMIHKFRKEGNIFGIATGRSIGSIAAEIEKYQIPVDFLVGNNGSIVLNKDNEELFYQCMDYETTLAILKEIPQEQVKFYGVSDGYQFGVDHKLLQQKEKDEEEDRHDSVEELINLQDILNNRNPVGIFVRFYDQDVAQSFANHCNFKYKGLIKAYAFSSYVEVITAGITKRSGLYQINDHFSFEGPIYVIGDSYNDIPMIKGFSGFAMCSGEEAVKELASRCFDTVGDALRFVLSQ